MCAKDLLPSLSLFCLLLPVATKAQTPRNKLPVTAFAEYGASVHTGEHVPLWQVSNAYGLSSLKNNTYVRAGALYADTLGRWRVQGCLDMAVAAGLSSTVVVQQAYADVRYWLLGVLAGAKELGSPLLNQELSSGDLTRSGNSRPVPQIIIGMPEYVRLGVFSFKVELGYGWFTDGGFWEKREQGVRPYIKGVKFHHKRLLMRFGKPQSKWLLDLGLVTDVQFGGYKYTVDGERLNMGNSIKDYLRVLIPGGGGDDTDINEQIFYQGNTVGSEYVMGTFRTKTFTLRGYLQNHFDDMSAMGKQNGFDGLWGLEYASTRRQGLSNVVLEYYQSTNQSGPMHGIDQEGVGKTGGGDNYYNHFLYGSWSHWGMIMGTPLVPSPVYNKNGANTLPYNRVQAVHLGVGGTITSEWSYTAKLTYCITFGTHYAPLIVPKENFSTFAAFLYTPHRMGGWQFRLSAALDTGNIYGDNLGFQLKIRRTF